MKIEEKTIISGSVVNGTGYPVFSVMTQATGMNSTAVIFTLTDSDWMENSAERRQQICDIIDYVMTGSTENKSGLEIGNTSVLVEDEPESDAEASSSGNGDGASVSVDGDGGSGEETSGSGDN